MSITKNKIIKIMEILQEAEVFEKTKMSNMSNSDRITASREAKRLVLAINKIYMNTKEATLMDLMKRLTSKKKSIDIRLKGRPNS
ncbi:MAG: hypothetical protein ACI87N_001009 [Flavobacteriales bacterium]|jgi:hypothetical protein